jgi:hypothetical protein
MCVDVHSKDFVPKANYLPKKMPCESTYMILSEVGIQVYPASSANKCFILLKSEKPFSISIELIQIIPFSN